MSRPKNSGSRAHANNGDDGTNEPCFKEALKSLQQLSNGPGMPCTWEVGGNGARTSIHGQKLIRTSGQTTLSQSCGYLRKFNWFGSGEGTFW